MRLVSGSKSMHALARNVMLLGALGEIVTIQIDLVGARSVEDLLKEEFNDSEKDGIYVNNMILQRIIEGTNTDYFSMFAKIAEITGDYESIDSITALIRVLYNNEPIEITVQLTSESKNPQLLQVTDQSIYFNLINLIKTRWAMASTMK